MTWKGYDEPFETMVQRKRVARMDKVDALSPEIRELVNDYGLNVVHNFMQNGVVKAARIRHLVELVLDEFSPTRGSFSKQGVRTEVANHLREPE